MNIASKGKETTKRLKPFCFKANRRIKLLARIISKKIIKSMLKSTPAPKDDLNPFPRMAMINIKTLITQQDQKRNVI